MFNRFILPLDLLERLEKLGFKSLRFEFQLIHCLAQICQVASLLLDFLVNFECSVFHRLVLKG